MCTKSVHMLSKSNTRQILTLSEMCVSKWQKVYKNTWFFTVFSRFFTFLTNFWTSFRAPFFITFPEDGQHLILKRGQKTRFWPIFEILGGGPPRRKNHFLKNLSVLRPTIDVPHQCLPLKVTKVHIFIVNWTFWSISIDFDQFFSQILTF